MVDDVDINYGIAHPDYNTITDLAQRLVPFFQHTDGSAIRVRVLSREAGGRKRRLGVRFGERPRRGHGGEKSFFLSLELWWRTADIQSGGHSTAHRPVYERWLECIGLADGIEVRDDWFYPKGDSPEAKHLPEPELLPPKELPDIFRLRDFESIDDVLERSIAYLRSVAYEIELAENFLLFPTREAYERCIPRLNTWGEWWEAGFQATPKPGLAPLDRWENDDPEWIPLLNSAGKRKVEWELVPIDWLVQVSLVREGRDRFIELSCLNVDIERFHKRLKKATGVDFDLVMPPEDRLPPEPAG